MPSRNRGRSKPSLRDRSRQEPTSEDLDLHYKAVSTGEPTTAAISGAILVEHELEVLLRGHFPRDDDETWALLNSERGPLHSFYAKLLMAFAFRILDDELLHNMNVIRRIRNAFAHSKKPIDFNDPLIKGVISSIKTPKRAGRRLTAALDSIRREDDQQRAYAHLCDQMAALLVARYSRRLKRVLKRLEKRIDRTNRSAVIKPPVVNALAMGTLFSGGQGLLSDHLEPWEHHQTNGPKDEALAPSPSKSRGKSKTPPRSEGR